MNRSLLGYAEIQQMEVEEMWRLRQREQRTGEVASKDSMNAPREYFEQRFVGQFRLTLGSIGGPRPNQRRETRTL